MKNIINKIKDAAVIILIAFITLTIIISMLYLFTLKLLSHHTKETQNTESPYEQSKSVDFQEYDAYGGYFTILTNWEQNNCKYCIAAAKDTGVKYLLADGPTGFHIATPLYNADGTIQVHNSDDTERTDK